VSSSSTGLVCRNFLQLWKRAFEGRKQGWAVECNRNMRIYPRGELAEGHKAMGRDFITVSFIRAKNWGMAS